MSTPEAQETESAAAQPQPAAAPEPAVPALEADGRKKWLIVAGGAKIPAGETRPVIVVQAASDPVIDPKTGYCTTPPALQKDGYPKGGDLYVRFDAEVAFPADAEVLTLGGPLEAANNMRQSGTWGFHATPGRVCVGPSHPAYAGANLAWQRGAASIEIIGLSDLEKAHLKPWFDALPRHPAGPADVKIALT